MRHIIDDKRTKFNNKMNISEIVKDEIINYQSYELSDNAFLPYFIYNNLQLMDTITPDTFVPKTKEAKLILNLLYERGYCFVVEDRCWQNRCLTIVLSLISEEFDLPHFKYKKIISK